MSELIALREKLQALPNFGEVMSNFDGLIEEGADEALRDGAAGSYPAWNFHGTVWHEDGEFHCAIMVYHIHQGVIKADTLEEIMQIASEEYGHQ